MPFSNVVLLPDQLELMQRVYHRIVSQPWFPNTVENQHALVALVVRAFQNGMNLEDRLYQHCTGAAKERFATPSLLK